MSREKTVFSVRSGRTVLLSILCAAILLLPAFCRAEEGTGRVLTIGKTDSIAPKAEQQLLPIVQYLARRLAERGIDEGQVLIRDSKEELAGQLREGNLDIVFSSPYPTVFYRRKAGTIPVLLGSRHGFLAYHSKIFVRQDSGLSGMADLSGKVIAFEDPGSTSEYFLPRFTMESEGLELVEMSSLDERPPPGKVGFIFSHDELNISSWVFLGKVDAGVMSSALWEEQKSNPDAYRSEFTVIHSTLDVPRLIVSVRAGLDETLRAEIVRLLLLMNGSPEGVKALAPYVAHLSAVIERLLPAAEEKSMTVVFEPKGEAPAYVSPLIEDVFENLISNALKYSPAETRIIVDIDSIGEELLVSVADQGDGIPDQFKEAVFERFKRGKQKGVKGSGLGLAIARRIVRFHGGRIWVEDAPEGGSVFFVRVPKGFPAA